MYGAVWGEIMTVSYDICKGHSKSNMYSFVEIYIDRVKTFKDGLEQVILSKFIWSANRMLHNIVWTDMG